MNPIQDDFNRLAMLWAELEDADSFEHYHRVGEQARVVTIRLISRIAREAPHLFSDDYVPAN